MEADARRLSRWVVYICLVVSAGACSSGGDGPAPLPAKAQESALPDDLAILGKLYAATVSTPSGFYADPRDDDAQSYTIHHLRNTDVGMDAAAPYELCADELSVALDWSETDAVRRPASGALLTTEENDLYYEFVRALADLPDWVSYGRVFKCGFVDRSGADARTVAGPAGFLTKPAFDDDDLRLVGQYFWTFSGFNNPGNAVLAGNAFSEGDLLGYTLTLAILRRDAGTQSGCDAIDVADWQFTARADDGFMEWTLRPLYSFEGRENGGLHALCDEN